MNVTQLICYRRLHQGRGNPLGGAVEPRGVSTGVAAGCDPPTSPAITPNSVRATSAPNPCTSWLIADSVGRVNLHSCESSQASSDTSAGTPSPISAATDRLATAMMSLSYRIAVGRSADAADSSDRVARAPASPE